MTKREKDKFEKEEAAKSGKKKKNKKVVRAGPRGFGQKIVETKDVDWFKSPLMHSYHYYFYQIVCSHHNEDQGN